MQTYFIFLRAVNVSGQNIVKMAELKTALEKKHFKAVKTYIQSGNIVLESSGSQQEVKQQITEILSTEFHLDIGVFVYTQQELNNIVEQIPFANSLPGNLIYITFLNQPTSITQIEELKKLQQTDEEMHHSPQILYFYFPQGMGKTKLTNTAIEKKLKLKSTARNRNTVEKMLALV